jgi:hypothetical protein
MGCGEESAGVEAIAAMPSFEVLAPRNEPDLGAYVGISLESIRTYPELISAIRQKRADFRESLCDPAALPFRCTLSREAFGNMYTVGFGYERKRRGMPRYHVLLDQNDRILCIENCFGYHSGLDGSTIAAYLAVRAIPLVIIGVFIFVLFKFVLLGG